MALLPSKGKFLKGLLDGFLRDDFQKTYNHASALMLPNDFALAPNTKFNFHVYFTLNDKVPNISAQDPGILGALVKSVKLPSYSMNTKEYIQYNRKRLIHNRIEYQPVTIKLHDDSSDLIRSMWYNYYQYYFADPRYTYDVGFDEPIKPKKGGFLTGLVLGSNPKEEAPVDGEDVLQADYSGRDLYSKTRPYQQNGWGVSTISPGGGGTKVSYFKDITIFGLSRGNFMAYTLINPLITNWDHDTYDYASGDGTMEHSMTLKYEAVKYTAGRIQDNKGVKVKGFAKTSRYDWNEGPFGKSGDAAIDFDGNPVNGILGTLKDLAGGDIGNVVKSATKAAIVIKEKGLGGAKDALLRDAGGILKGAAISSVGNVFPSNGLAAGKAAAALPDPDIGEIEDNEF